MNKELKLLWEKFAKHKEGKWIIGSKDAQRIYDIVMKIKPKKVLELGGGIGCSASVIALAMKDLGFKPADIDGDAEIDSVEQFKKCIYLAEELIPGYLQEYITIHFSETKAVKFKEIPYRYFTVYDSLPIDDYGLVVIDGPGPWAMGRQWIKLTGGDILNLVSNLKEDALVYIDQRKDLSNFIYRYLSDYFETLVDTNEYSLFKRTGKEYKGEVKDLMFEQMEKLDYF